MKCLQRRLKRLSLPPMHPVAQQILLDTYGPLKGRLAILVVRAKIAQSLRRVPQQKGIS